MTDRTRLEGVDLEKRLEEEDFEDFDVVSLWWNGWSVSVLHLRKDELKQVNKTLQD